MVEASGEEDDQGGPLTQARDKINAFLVDMGFDPAQVASVEIGPHVMWVHLYERDEDGKLYIDKYGYVAKRTEKVLLNDFLDVTSTGG